MNVISQILAQGRTMVSEYEAKQVLAAYHIPVVREVLVANSSDLGEALKHIGFPLVMKGCSPEVAHKTEKGLVQVDVRGETEAAIHFDRIMAALDGQGAVLVQELIKGKRELAVGMIRDPQFGPAVMFGLGGIFLEVLRDVAFRVAPLARTDALEMMQDIKGHKILTAIRGMAAADLDTLSRILIQVGQIGLDFPRIKEIDLNPVILTDSGGAVAVDALIVLE